MTQLLSKHWSSPACTTVTPSWLDSQPLQLNLCSLSRTLQCASFTVYLNSPNWPPSSVTSTGFLLQPASDSRRWCWPSRSSTELHLSTPALHSTTSAGWLVPPSLSANKSCPAKSQLLLFSYVLAPHWWNKLPTMSGQQNHSPSSTKDSRLICMYMQLYVSYHCTLILALMHLKYPWWIWKYVLFLFFLFTSSVTCCGFFLVTNVLIASRFGQKHLLNAPNLNVNVTEHTTNRGLNRKEKHTTVSLVQKQNRKAESSRGLQLGSLHQSSWVSVDATWDKKGNIFKY